MTHLRHRGAIAALLLMCGGCADRGVISGPESPIGAGEWITVGVAATAAALVLAAHITPATRPGGARFASALLAVQAGAATIGCAVIVGAAVRSAQLVDRPSGAEQAASMLRLTGLDGRDVGFFRLLAVLTILLGGLLVIVLALGSRFAADDDPVERGLASAMLALELTVSGAAVVLFVVGYRDLPIALTAAALPLLVVAVIDCWPRPGADLEDLGYNGDHG